MKKRMKFPKMGGRVLFNEPLSRHTSFGIGGRSYAWTEPSSESELKDILDFARATRKKIFVIGMGSNILFRDRGFSGIVVHLGKGCFKKIKFSGTELTAGAGVSLMRLVDVACGKGLGGIEGLAGIPGTVGGAVFMNSGYRTNIKDAVRAVKVMDKKNARIRLLEKNEINFGYRHSGLDDYIILEATLSLRRKPKRALLERKKNFMEMKWKTQPLGRRSAGCVFRNPGKKMSAAGFIENAGLKGKKVGGAEVSEKHANFIINAGGATGGDVLRLMSAIRRRVKSRFKVNLIPEIIIV